MSFSDGQPGIRVKSPGEPMHIGEIDPEAVSSTNEPPKLTKDQAAAHTAGLPMPVSGRRSRKRLRGIAGISSRLPGFACDRELGTAPSPAAP